MSKKKSLEELRVPELDQALEFFGVEAPEGANKAAKVAALAEFGVTREEWDKHLGTEEEDDSNVVTSSDARSEVKTEEVRDEQAEPRRVQAPETKEVVLVMERANPTYVIYGVTFTRTHPYAVVSEEVAERIMRNHRGFRPAAPHEIREYYG